MVHQKYIRHNKRGSKNWLLDSSGGSSYLASQCPGHAGLEKDLKAGWRVKHSWEDAGYVVLIMEHEVKSENRTGL